MKYVLVLAGLSMVCPMVWAVGIKLEDNLTIVTSQTTLPIAFPEQAEKRDNPASMLSETSSLRAVQVRGTSDGTIVVVYPAARDQEVGVLRINRRNEVVGPELRIAVSGAFQDFVVHEDGAIALLVRTDHSFNLIKVDGSGKTIFSRTISTGPVRNLYVGNVEWDGSQYVAYFGIRRMFDWEWHDGNTGVEVSSDGSRLRTRSNFDWTCSHSIDQRIINLGDRLEWLCSKDAFSPGLWYAGIRVASYWGDAAGRTGGRIGSAAVSATKVAIAYSVSGYGYVGIYHRNKEDQKNGTRLATQLRLKEDGQRSHESVKVGALGDSHFVYSWREGSGKSRFFRLLDENGNSIGEAEKLEVPAQPRGDFRTAPNGDMIWAAATDDHTLKIMRLRPPH